MAKDFPRQGSMIIEILFGFGINNVYSLQDISNKKEETVDSIKSIMESRDLGLELGGYGVGIGLGLRATIPKMPSFRRKRKIPSPVVMDEDSSKRLSDQVN